LHRPAFSNGQVGNAIRFCVTKLSCRFASRLAGKLALLVAVSFYIIIVGMFSEHQKDHFKRWPGHWLAVALA
jgi:hypothetical protein